MTKLSHPTDIPRADRAPSPALEPPSTQPSSGQALGLRAERQNLSVSFIDKENGTKVTLSSTSKPPLRLALALSDEAFAHRFGDIDRRDFNGAVTDALNLNQQSHHLDLTAAAHAIYTDAADFSPTTPPRGPDALVDARVTGMDGAFDVTGSVVKSDRSFWSLIGDIILEVITLGFASTSWGDGAIDEPEWQTRGQLLAAAGGSAFRAALDSGEAQERLRSIIGREGSNLSDKAAAAMAETMLEGAKTFYQRIESQHPGNADATLDQIAETFRSGSSQRLFMRAIEEAAPEQQRDVSEAMLDLVSSPSFQSLNGKTQVTLLSQAANYANPTSIHNLRRVAAADWFRTRPSGVSAGMSELAHQQRSAMMVAGLSARADSLARLDEPTAGQREARAILDNTVGQFLPTIADDGTITQGRFDLNWRSYLDPPGSITFGSAYSSTLSLNQNLVPANNNALPDNTLTRHLVMSTVPHEVNHLMNGDLVRPTFEYFMGEYGAWYAGHVAEHGQEPSRQECYDRAQYLLTRTTGAYDFLRRARLSTNDDGTPTDEAQAIIRFMGQFFDDPKPTTAAAIVPAGHAVSNGDVRTRESRPPTVEDEPLIRTNRNMDNSGDPIANRTGPSQVDYSEVDAHFGRGHRGEDTR